MGNPEQIERIKQGSEVWNTWRKQHPTQKVDLSDADLRGADLRGVYLSSNNINGANLINANFSDANLSSADLSYSDLIGADLSSANLSNTNLSNTNLRDANLRGANLYNTNLRGVELSDADLSGAQLVEAELSDADLSDADLSYTHLSGANLSGANLSSADLYHTNFSSANLSDTDLSSAHLGSNDLSGAQLVGANLSGANLSGGDLRGANLSGAQLVGAQLVGANLSGAQLVGANLSGANLSRALLVETNFTNAILTHCSIYGIAAWKVQLEGAKQENLVLTDEDEPIITVDNLKIAQFLYLLINNEEIRDVIDTIAKKAVLILGRFTPERKHVLDALREELRNQDYLPILFDFEKPTSHDFTETVSTLAHLARFVIADLTDAKSLPQELQAIIPGLAVPIQPLLLVEQQPYAMFRDFRKYPWVLPPYYYPNQAILLAALNENIIKPAEQKAQELQKQKTQDF